MTSYSNPIVFTDVFWTAVLWCVGPANSRENGYAAVLKSAPNYKAGNCDTAVNDSCVTALSKQKQKHLCVPVEELMNTL